MIKSIVAAAAASLSLPLFAACSTEPNAAELCTDSIAKKCVQDGTTQSTCTSNVQAILDAGRRKGSACEDSVDRYLECIRDTLDSRDQCADHGDDFIVTCNQVYPDCAFDSDSDPSPSADSK